MSELVSSIKEIISTPDEYKSEDNPLGKIGNIVFGPMVLGLGKEPSYVLNDTFTHGEQEVINGRAYFASETLDIVAKIGPESGFTMFQQEAKVYNSAGSELQGGFLFNKTKFGRAESGLWEKWNQGRMIVCGDPNAGVKNNGRQNFLELMEEQNSGTYTVKCIWWLVASPGKYEKKEYDNEKGTWVMNKYWLDDKYYILSAGSFNYIIPEGHVPKKPEPTQKEESAKKGIKGLKGKLKGKMGEFAGKGLRFMKKK